MIKAICFDLDGVLVDACEWHRLAFNQALEEYTGSSITLQDHKNIYNGLPTVKKLELLGITEKELIEKINDRKQEITKEYIKKLSIDEEKIELLKFLKSKKILIACVTNSVRETTKPMLVNTGQYNYFDLIVTNQDVRNPKPSSEPYVHAMVSLGSFPGQTWIVEDSEKGIASAKNTGANLIVVENSKQVNLSNIRRELNL